MGVKEKNIIICHLLLGDIKFANPHLFIIKHQYSECLQPSNKLEICILTFREEILLLIILIMEPETNYIKIRVTNICIIVVYTWF